MVSDAATDTLTDTALPGLRPDPLRQLFDLQWQASRAQPEVSLALRRDRLARLDTLLTQHAAELSAAVNADFGVRSPALTQLADFFVLHSLMAHTRRHLRAWMRSQRVATPLYLLPARGHVQRQPLGVVGVVAPWNYPVQLAFGPVLTALAAGNRVMLKPSEQTPQTSALMAELVGRAFAPDEFCVVQGRAEVASAFASLPFDHLFFTGSTTVGRKVALAAAANLTPTTLELGGKSPCIVDASCRIEDAALKIAHGKLFNAGQTCIAPDYLLLPRGREEAFAEAFARAVARLFPRIAGNPDYTAILDERQHARLQHLLADAEAQGASLQVIDPHAGPAFTHGEAGMPLQRQMPPVLVFGAHGGMRLMTEEIFGPVLPVLAYDDLDAAIAYVNAGPRPLALYFFGDDRRARGRVLAQTVSGGVTVNDTLLHVAHEGLPFGGVGESGWGAYHGETGFLRFSQQKAVLLQSRLGLGRLMYPPYGPRLAALMRWIKRLG